MACGKCFITIMVNIHIYKHFNIDREIHINISNQVSNESIQDEVSECVYNIKK